MELKKNPKADVAKKSGMFFNLSLAIVMGIVILAFEYKSFDDGKLVNLGELNDNFEDLMEIPPTEQPPPPPPKIQLPKVVEIPDEEEIEEEIEIEIDVEVTEDTEIEEVIFEEPEEEEIVDEVFTIVEDSPEPKGGMPAFYKYISKNMTYPSQARRMGIEGRVFVQFVVDKDGTIREVKAVKGIGGGCDEEAVRVIKTSPKWKPGKQRGRPVKVRMILPVQFKLS